MLINEHKHKCRFPKYMALMSRWTMSDFKSFYPVQSCFTWEINLTCYHVTKLKQSYNSVYKYILSVNVTYRHHVPLFVSISSANNFVFENIIGREILHWPLFNEIFCPNPFLKPPCKQSVNRVCCYLSHSELLHGGKQRALLSGYKTETVLHVRRQIDLVTISNNHTYVP